MKLLTTNGWDDYELLDSGNGRRLERFGTYVLSRPDPQCIWLPKRSTKEWEKAVAIYEVQRGEQGQWRQKKPISQPWIITYNDLKFNAYLTPFKHTGIFPEQHLHWDWMKEIIENGKLKMENGEIRILNLFGYTGGATLVCAAAGANVTHIDASRKSIQYAKENQESSNLTEKPIRWILDDAMAFVKREVRRGNTYHGIIMDPPVFGHGPDGSTWDFQRDFPLLIKECKSIFDKDGLFFLVNAYAISASSIMLENVLSDYLPQGSIEGGELVLEESSGRQLSTGIYARWERS